MGLERRNMGTNYFLITKNHNIAHKYFAEEVDYGSGYFEYLNKEYELKDVPDFHYEIHLNKCSCGWRPLFQKHKCFKTFDELEKFFNKYQSDLLIKDEYNESFDWQEYKDTIMYHANQTPQPCKWVYEENEFYGHPGHKCLTTKKCAEDEAELYTPFNHLEYGKTYKIAQDKFNVHEYINVHENYWNDPDYKVDWTDGDFR